MKGKRYTTEQKIRVLREAERTKEFGMMEVDQAKQLKALQKENARLKRMLAD